MCRSCCLLPAIPRCLSSATGTGSLQSSGVLQTLIKQLASVSSLTRWKRTKTLASMMLSAIQGEGYGQVSHKSYHLTFFRYVIQSSRYKLKFAYFNAYFFLLGTMGLYKSPAVREPYQGNLYKCGRAQRATKMIDKVG